MTEDRSYIEENARSLERMRSLVDDLSEDELRRPVNEYWTVAGVLGHIAFWDARILALCDKLDRGVPFAASDTEPEDVDWINDASRALIHAVPPVSWRGSRCRSPRRPTRGWRRFRRTGSGRRTPTVRSTPCARRTAASTSTTSRRRWIVPDTMTR